MKTNKIRVGVNGYGVIGKRVADAVRVQPDMELVGVSDIIYTYQVDNQSIAIPENIDAIRALSGIVKDGQESIRMTNEALGIKRYFIGRLKKEDSDFQ